MKCGGSTLAALPTSFFEDMRQLQEEGIDAGHRAWRRSCDFGDAGEARHRDRFVNGLRKTNEDVLDVVEMVLSGQINKEIVRRIQLTGAKALGLSGVDGQLDRGEARSERHEVGFVGDVTDVNAELIQGIVGMGYIPVIAPIGIDADGGQRYNINADTAAGAVASHLGVEQMIVVTDVPGIMKTVDGEKQVLPSVTRSRRSKR